MDICVIVHTQLSNKIYPQFDACFSYLLIIIMEIVKSYMYAILNILVQVSQVPKQPGDFEHTRVTVNKKVDPFKLSFPLICYEIISQLSYLYSAKEEHRQSFAVNL